MLEVVTSLLTLGKASEDFNRSKLGPYHSETPAFKGPAMM